MIISAALTTRDQKLPTKNNEHFYRPDFLIQSVYFKSAAVTFISKKKQKKVSGNIKRS